MHDVGLLERDHAVAARVRRAVVLQRHDLVAHVLAPRLRRRWRSATTISGCGGAPGCAFFAARAAASRCSVGHVRLRQDLLRRRLEDDVAGRMVAVVVRVDEEVDRADARSRSLIPSRQIFAVAGICASITTTLVLSMCHPMVPPWPVKYPTVPRMAVNAVCGGAWAGCCADAEQAAHVQRGGGRGAGRRGDELPAIDGHGRSAPSRLRRMTEKYCTIRVARGILPMLLRRIEIQNFRGLRSAVVDLDETTALIGENSAGKTTLLDAVAICCSGRDDTVTLEVRDFRQEGQAPPSETLGIALTFDGTDAEWAEPAARAVSPIPPRGLARAPDRSGSRCPARVDPARNAVEASWTFAGAEGQSSGPQPGLLAEWRRLTPMLRLRANRYVEQDPRGAAAAAATGGAGVAAATDPVARAARAADSPHLRPAHRRVGHPGRRTATRPRCGRGVPRRSRSLPPRAHLANAAVDERPGRNADLERPGRPSRCSRASSRAGAPAAWRSSG